MLSILTSLPMPVSEESTLFAVSDQRSAAKSMIALLYSEATFRTHFFPLQTRRLKPQAAAALILRVPLMMNRARPMALLRNFIPSWPCLSFEWHFYFVSSCPLFL
jgi:hypothetical protein